MATTDDGTFNQFVTRWKKKLRGIAHRTAGEQQYADVVQEAWLMARTLPAADGSPLDLRDEAHQHRLLAHLYQHLVRYTEVTVRHAVQLDHAPPRRDDGENVHPLVHMLASDAGRDVLGELLERAADQSLEAALQAGAYVPHQRPRGQKSSSSPSEPIRIPEAHDGKRTVV